MPVYLDEKDSRREFIEEQLKKVDCGLSEFMAYIHMSTEFGWECGDDIDEFIASILDRFPHMKTDALLEEIAEHMEGKEREYYAKNNQFKVDYELSLSRTGGY